MFENVGGKIKVLAKVVFWIAVVAAVIYGFVQSDATDGLSLLLAAAYILVALITTWFLYGFGEIIEMLVMIERNTRSAPKDALRTVRIEKLEKLREQGVISEEEYQQAVKQKLEDAK